MAERRDLTQLSFSQQRLIFEALERREQMEAGVSKRKNRRFIVQAPYTAVIHLESKGVSGKCTVLMRNLSAAGCSFLHSIFIYPQTQCHVELRTVDGELTMTPGVIKRCSHVSGWIHEIGVQFNKPIDVEGFIAEADHAQISESEDPVWTEARELLNKLKCGIEGHDPALCKATVAELVTWGPKLTPPPKAAESAPAEAHAHANKA